MHVFFPSILLARLVGRPLGEGWWGREGRRREREKEALWTNDSITLLSETWEWAFFYMQQATTKCHKNWIHDVQTNKYTTTKISRQPRVILTEQPKARLILTHFTWDQWPGVLKLKKKTVLGEAVITRLTILLTVALLCFGVGHRDCNKLQYTLFQNKVVWLLEHRYGNARGLYLFLLNIQYVETEIDPGLLS